MKMSSNDLRRELAEAIAEVAIAEMHGDHENLRMYLRNRDNGEGVYPVEVLDKPRKLAQAIEQWSQIQNMNPELIQSWVNKRPKDPKKLPEWMMETEVILQQP